MIQDGRKSIKRQELEEASRLQFRAPFLEPESEAVHADEAA